MDQDQIIQAQGETSTFVEAFTAVLPFLIIVILAIVIFAIVYLFKIVHRYLENGKLAEEKLRMEQEDIKDIKVRLERVEKVLDEVE